MDEGVGGALRQLGYSRARRLLLLAGLTVLLVIAGVLYLRRVDPIEVGATLLFVPVFIGFLFWNAKGGIAAGVIASAVYAALRYDAIAAVGVRRFAGLLASRAVAFLAFGIIGGWASKQLASSLLKLETYDQIDDETALFNARFLLQVTDLERSRAARYRTIFSVVEVAVPVAALTGLSRRRRVAALRDLGGVVRDAVRTVDQASHARDEIRHRLVVVLPETGSEGAKVLAERLATRVASYLAERGLESEVTRSWLTFPGDEARLDALRGEFAEIDRGEHPEEVRPPAQMAGGASRGRQGTVHDLGRGQGQGGGNHGG